MGAIIRYLAYLLIAENRESTCGSMVERSRAPNRRLLLSSTMTPEILKCFLLPSFLGDLPILTGHQAPDTAIGPTG